jgi:hypothetical protein
MVAVAVGIGVWVAVEVAAWVAELFMMHLLGCRIVSTYNSRIRGPVIGYGTIAWPMEDDSGPRVVYLIQIAQGSFSLGPAIAVLSADYAVTEESL